MRHIWVGALVLGCLLSARAQTAPPHVGVSELARGERVEVRGVVEKVQIVPGQGMPFLEVKDDKGTVKVYLGSMRYLMEKNFGPRAGIRVVVKGFKVESDVYARSVEIPAEKKSIELRSEDGTPLWRMGRYGRK